MAANINGPIKNNAFTLIFRDSETNEIFTHEFMHHEEHIYGDELDKFLLLPAAEMLEEAFIDSSDEEDIQNFADTLEAIAVIKGHPDVETVMGPSSDYNPHLDIFGKPILRLI